MMNQKIYTVSQLNTETRLLLEGHFSRLWVSGEISNLASPNSGHIYFSLKDEQAQVRCAMFRNQKNLLSFSPQNGMQVLVQTKVSLYEERGDYQLIVDYMEPMGDGLLRQAFERLKAKLESEGLFKSEYKRKIPAFPQKVGVITSPTGAAIHDIVSVLKRRFPAIQVLIYPCQVQGELAVASIISALKNAEEQSEADVLIVARGGGSLEDLQAFNNEEVARALFACHIPTVSGVGHEVDTTIVDYIADMRAATPTAAAELVSPDQFELFTQYQNFLERLYRNMLQFLQTKKQMLKYVQNRLRDPQYKIIENTQRLDHLQLRLTQAQLSYLIQLKTQLQLMCLQIEKHHPNRQLEIRQTEIANLSQRLSTQINYHLTKAKQQFQELTRALDAVNPLAILQRGYAITSTLDGKIIHHAADLKIGDRVLTKLSKGQIICEVKGTFEEN